MFDQLQSFAQLIKTLQQVPYLASKNVYKVADFFLGITEKQLEQFCAVLLTAHERIRPCPVCFCWYEVGKLCFLCSDTTRDHSLVCVVETWHEMLVIEKTKGYQGVYHILGGAICPLEGIGPDELTINQLIERVNTNSIKELILATNQTPEGEATAAYIARKLEASQVQLSCLARGLPVGSSIESMDRLTIFKALNERRLF